MGCIMILFMRALEYMHGYNWEAATRMDACVNMRVKFPAEIKGE